MKENIGLDNRKDNIGMDKYVGLVFTSKSLLLLGSIQYRGEVKYTSLSKYTIGLDEKDHPCNRCRKPLSFDCRMKASACFSSIFCPLYGVSTI